MAAGAKGGACEPDRFLRGDAGCSFTVELSDAVFVFDFLFRGGPAPECPDAADADDSGEISISDGIAILNRLFRGGELAPPVGRIGPDPTLDALACYSGRDPCSRLREVAVAGRVTDSRIAQPSGLAASRRHAGVFWVVNDFDAERDPRVFAIDASGVLRAVLELCAGEDAAAGVDSCAADADPTVCSASDIHCDWEGIAVGPGPDPGGRDCIFIGDLGGNRFRNRAVFAIHCVPEPETLDPAETVRLVRDRGDFETIRVTPPADREYFDAEVLLVDPATGAVFVVSESPRREFFGVPLDDARALAAAGGAAGRLSDPVELEPLGVISLGGERAILSAGDVSPEGSRLVLKANADVFVMPWRPDAPASPVAAGEVCHLSLVEFLGFFDGAVGFAPFHAGAVAFASERELLSLEEYSNSLIFRLEFARGFDR